MKAGPSYKNRSFSIHYNDPGQRDFVEKTGSFHEVEMLDFIAKNIKRKGLWLDIGACSGNHSIFFSKFCTAEKIASFEPTPGTYKTLVENLFANSCKNVCPYPVALGDHTCIAGISENENPGQNRVVEGDTVLMTTVDYYVGSWVSLIKIDVEGHEKRVLAGAMRTISRCKPELFIESFTGYQWILDLLPEGYKMIRLFNNAPTYYFSYERSK